MSVHESRSRSVSWLRVGAGGLAVGLMILTSNASAATIEVTPADSFAKIEAAKPGDVVLLAPGIYAFRVLLTAAGTATNPIVIKAKDPANRPVWDFGSTKLDVAPGNPLANARAAFQIAGGTGYVLEGIDFRNCRNAAKFGAGVYYHDGADVIVRDCRFAQSDNGITGGYANSTAVVEFCEFAGNTKSSLNVVGGTFTLRYSYLHDTAGWNFWVGAVTGTLEANWFARAAGQEGIFAPADEYKGPGPYTQTLLLAGNVFVQAEVPSNRAAVIDLLNDRNVPGENLKLRAVNNTFVGNGQDAAFVRLSNADHTTMSAELVNNVLAGTTTPTSVVDAANGTISGTHNWLPTGVPPGALQASIYSPEPGFVDGSRGNYRLATGSEAIARASSGVAGAPTHEYYLNETITCGFRARATVKDLGAFESTTQGPGTGAHGTIVETNADAGTDTGADAASATPVEGAQGCGCTSVGAGQTLPGLAAALTALAAALARRRAPGAS